QPPPLPPACYRAVRYQTPEGYRAIEDWFGGFRHGVAAAREGGYRDYVTGPSSFRAPLPDHSPSAPPEATPPATLNGQKGEPVREGEPQGVKSLCVEVEWGRPLWPF